MMVGMAVRVGGAREEEVNCFVCLPSGYDADAARRSVQASTRVHGKQQQTAEFRIQAALTHAGRRGEKARPLDRRGTSELSNN